MNKETTIFIDTQDMEERYGEQLYQEYLEKENERLREKVSQLEKENQKLKKMHNHYYKYAIDQENKYVVAKAITDWLKLWLEEEMLEGRSEENQWLMGCYDQCKETLDKIKELEGGSNE